MGPLCIVLVYSELWFPQLTKGTLASTSQRHRTEENMLNGRGKAPVGELTSIRNSNLTSLDNSNASSSTCLNCLSESTRFIEIY
jgi:hypothetical protein